MDFSKIESSLYGDVEDDGDLLAELMELENEEKRKVQSSNQKRAPARNLAAAPARGRGSGLDPKALSEALRDIPDDDGDISDGIEDDEELLGELADLVSDDEAPAAPRGTPSVPQAARAAPATPAKDNGVIAKLKDAENAYKKMKDGAAGNSSKIRRYDRALTKIAELTKKAERGIAVDPLEIPVLPNQGIGEASKDPQASEAPRPGPPPVPNRMASIEKPLPPALPPRVVQVEKPELPTRKPEPMEEKTPTSSATSDSAKLLALLQSRRVAYLQNAHTAAKADDKVAAGEFVTVAKQFDEAIKAVNEGLLTECDEDEIPPMPQPYKVPPSKLPPPKTLAEDLKQRMEAFHQLTAKYKSEGNERKTRFDELSHRPELSRSDSRGFGRSSLRFHGSSSSTWI
ncbi:hypothetical protein L596_008331 [Steinernema carpocapsae]|uniref:DM14 domain-containing protein n=1 Tax=Steinernema carpocapsae TaxID=34508 RepID=A0A4U5PCN5_STECR|nr:hypothetical protein L596_008331 [Steinernema carpocapsae]